MGICVFVNVNLVLVSRVLGFVIVVVITCVVLLFLGIQGKLQITIMTTCIVELYILGPSKAGLITPIQEIKV